MVSRKSTSWLVLFALLVGAPASFAQRSTALSPIHMPTIKRDWGPEQACGPPDTPNAGDIPTAWASLTQDNQDEWLLLTYDEAITPIQILIYESFNPGAVTRITAVDDNGKETDVWQGSDPTSPTAEQGVSTIQVKPGFTTKKIKLYLDSKKISGWNEIDAVGLVDEKSEKPVWAVAAEASSTYAERPVMQDPLTELQQRVETLEKRTHELEDEIKELKSKRKRK